MRVFVTTAAATVLLSGCAQFTTSDAERNNLQSVADARAETYIDCMKSEAASITSTTDYRFIAQAVSSRCRGSLDDFRQAQNQYLASQFMMTRQPLEESVAELEQRAQDEIAELLVARDTQRAAPAPVPVPSGSSAAAGSSVPAPSAATSGRSAPPPSAATSGRSAPAGMSAAPPASAGAPTSAPAAGSEGNVAGLNLSSSSPVVAASAAAVGITARWNPEQRVYLDCMDEQADKYGRLNESAEAIAAVAADRCRSYLTVERRQALEEEGKVRVMGKIMDKRISGAR